MTEKQQRPVEAPVSASDAGRMPARGDSASPAIDGVRGAGERLAAERAAKGRSIDEMAARLKVTPQKLAALEQGDVSPLPDFTFAVGLVRSYAKMLGLDPLPLVDAMRRGGGAGAAPSSLELPSSPGSGGGLRRAHVPLTWSTRRSDRRSWIVGGVAVAVVLLALVVWRFVNEPNGLLSRNAAPAAASAASTAGVGSGMPGTVTTVLPGAGGATSGATAALASGSSAPLASQPVAVNASGTIAAVAVSSTATASGVTLAADGAPAGNVRIVAKTDSWVSVRDAHNKEVFRGMVRADTPQTIDVARPGRVVVGNISGIDSIMADGQPVDLQPYLSRRNRVARIPLP